MLGPNPLSDKPLSGLGSAILGSAIGAANFASASSQSLSVASNSSLQTGGGDFWLSCWINLADKSTSHSLIAKDLASNREFDLYFAPANPPFTFEIAGGAGPQTSTALANIVLGTWYYLFAYYNKSTTAGNIQLLGGGLNVAGGPVTNAGPSSGSANFTIGNRSFGGGSGSQFMSGKMDSVCFGKLASGGIASVASAIQTALYNGGAGCKISSLTPTQKTNWGVVSGWDFDTTGTLLTDAVGSNTLTNNNGVTCVPGFV